MKLNNHSGKKFRDSCFCNKAFEKLKKDEYKKRIYLNILFFSLMLVAEYSVFLLLYRF